MLENIKEKVWLANLKLAEYSLAILTWGNASQISEDRKYVVIKPSGVSYETMKAEDMSVVDLDGNVVEGNFRPSSDLMTHLELYRSFDSIYGIVHTHSKFAVGIAQAECSIPCYGTTHADNFFGKILCTRPLTEEEVGFDYELNTGRVIAETIKTFSIAPEAVPGILVCKHGPFTWGANVEKAVENALVLEEVSHMAVITKMMNQAVEPAPQYLVDKHYYRKHGKDSYYGQK